MSDPDFTASVGIVGLGLIGGSIGLSLREPGSKIIGCDLSPQSEKVAKDRFCVDEIAPIEQVAQAEFVFIAVPPAALVEVSERVSALTLPNSVLTDCGSVKAEISAWALQKKLPNFVPGHPMAGHEKSGPEYASAWLFRGAKWLLTPTRHTSRSTCGKLEKLIKKLGAIPMRLNPEDHDRHVAVLSHLPHVLAGALLLEGSELEHIEVGAGSWRDLTRVGGVDPELWTQILSGNRVELCKALAEFEGSLRRVRGMLEAGDAAGLKGWLGEAKTVKSRQTPKAAEPPSEKKRVMRQRSKRPNS